uniref:Protein C06A8.2 n=1 Tax=Haemonchus contortus TaxID=6289 RepID=W6NB63_HAECO
MSVSKARMPDVCSAIEDDLCTLLQAFKEKASLRLVKFYEVAADYRLQDVYAGRLNVAEYLEIPTTCSDLDLLLNFVKSTLIPYRHLDAVGCIYKLVYDDAFAIMPFHNDFDPATQKKYYSSTTKDGEDHEQENYVPLEITRSILEGPVFKTMLRVQTQMTDIGKSSCDPNLQITEKDTSFTERIEEIFVQLQNELADVDKEKVPDNTESHPEVKTEEANDESLGKSRSSIRNRAFNTVISFCRGKRAIHSEDQVKNVIVKTESPDAASESELRAVKEEPQEGSQCENNPKEGKFARKTPMRDTAKATTDGIEKANR